MKENVESFIVFKGIEYDNDTILSTLKIICPDDYKIKCLLFNEENLLIAKIFPEGESFKYNLVNRGAITVNGYNKEEIKIACEKNSNINTSVNHQQIINGLYQRNREEIFLKLSEYMHFCSVIYDEFNDNIIAGVTEPNSQDTHLYYGYTKKNNELMFSNNEFLLQQFCDKIQEMDENTYMKNGEIYNLNGEKYMKSEKLFKQINDLDIIMDELTRKKIKSSIDEYLSSSAFKQRVNNFVLTHLNVETKKKTLEIIKEILQNYNLEDNIKQKLDNIVEEKLKEFTNKIDIPVVNIIKLGETVLGQTKGGFYHEKFEQILTQVQLDEPIMLIGPAGSGKNVAISQVADALGKHMYYTNNASNEFKLTGFIDAGGNYRDTEFYKAFKNGGIFFLDEIDNSDPSALIVINSALANGYMAFPHETIDRHPDFRIIAAANTWGKGADLQYVGRNALDGATLDRFDNIFFDYDTKLEKFLYPNNEVLEFMWSFRNAVYQTRIPHIVSTRGIGKVYKKEINGIPVRDILTSNVIKNLGQDDINTIIGNMENIDSCNKYYQGIKRLRLNR